ncbi:DUF5008 domain-containing protein [Chitinophaga lutea]|uniref:DUF5008 domain-containing protein n=1 Tax=Chitinophaga lutea TaxID=2488634 RepID=A0A3N4PYM8_9BACT|nr:DUF5008 domain-containing protein [Chitinophaga lutea]RPE11989.1 DUF5008 domain-containing protein [Chitinophaga lutea]
MKKLLVFILFASAAFACRRDEQIFENPYEGGKQPLGIKFLDEPPSVPAGEPGAMVSFKVKGLLPYKSRLVFSFNGQPAEVTELDSTHVSVKVPELASTGNVQIVVDDQAFYGPVFNVLGKIENDITFRANVGTNGPISKMPELPDGRFLLIGNFTNYENKGAVTPLNRIIVISRNEELDRTMLFGKGAYGPLSDVVVQPNGKMLVAGNFSGFDRHFWGVKRMFNVCRLNANGSPDTTVVQSFTKKDTVPVWKGGTDGSIARLFQDANGRTVAIGDFNYFVQKRYGVGTADGLKDSLVTDSVEVSQMLRFNSDGSLDSTYHYDLLLHKGRPATNGYISDAVMQPDGKLIIVGRFSRYDDMQVSNIARINPDGSPDRTFTATADDAVQRITYNAVTKQYVLAGIFNNYNKTRFNKIVLVDESFNPVAGFATGMLEGGGINQATQLSNGLIFVTGFFSRYDNVQRNGIMVLDARGKLAAGYNAIGKFYGFLSGVVESRALNGDMRITLLGSFNSFNGQSAGNFTRLLVK